MWNILVRHKTIWTTVFFSIFCASKILGSLFENSYNHQSGVEITGIQICGERCSGTNFIAQLIHKNFPEFRDLDFQKFGRKHFLWWFSFPVDKEKLRRLRYNVRMVALEDSECCLFIMIVRDPYDWLRSVYLKPHHVSSQLKNKDFFYFISNEWHIKEKENFRPREIDGYNPYTEKPFRNVLELRKYKMINYLTLGKLVDNFLLVKYEDVARNPKQFIHFISEFYGLKKNQEFIPILRYKGIPNNHLYKRKKYFPIKGRVLDYINQNLDWEIENDLGYFLKTKVE